MSAKRCDPVIRQKRSDDRVEPGVDSRLPALFAIAANFAFIGTRGGTFTRIQLPTSRWKLGGQPDPLGRRYVIGKELFGFQLGPKIHWYIMRNRRNVVCLLVG